MTAFKINPVILDLGVIQIRWYSLSYILGILIGLFLAQKILEWAKIKIKKEKLRDYINWVVISIILGGRLGYVAFYNFDYYLSNPIEIFKIYNGGMSFHGALISYLIFTYIFAKKNKLDWRLLLDVSALVVPIGLFLGRIANFINSELYGRVTNISWGIIYPTVDFKTRHPSQIYEAMLEGVLLFILLNYLNKKFSIIKYRLLTTSLFLVFYSIFRIFAEFYREPDYQIGFFFKYFTLGQILSLFMLLIGIFLLIKIKKSYVYKR
ncbi:MAG: prolipoprotein diacylglyceryl transferase [Rickettsia sp.]|nr:prolipoprotein diacylglyceryl transferase [Rickettsia sp.]